MIHRKKCHLEGGIMATHINCAVVGGPFVGKTSCIQSYIQKRSELKKFEGEDGLIHYFSTSVQLDDDREINLHIWDAGRAEGSERARISVYPKIDVIIIMFDLVRKDTQLDVENFWYREIGDHCPNVPIILVGTKCDLKENKRYRNTATTYNEGMSLAKHIKARKYLECSSKTLDGLNSLFQEVALAVLEPSTITSTDYEVDRHTNSAQGCCCSIL